MTNNYPPGCNDDDIARTAGYYPEACPKCDEVFFANELNEDGICEICEKQERFAKQTVPKQCGHIKECNCFRQPKKVRKIGGSFQHTGTIVSKFLTLIGEPRIVIEFDAPVDGMLHIYRPDQVEEIQ